MRYLALTLLFLVCSANASLASEANELFCKLREGLGRDYGRVTAKTFSDTEISRIKNVCETDEKGNFPILIPTIKGEIGENTLKFISNLESALKSGLVKSLAGSITLDSPGGDISIAMEIGRWVWENELSVSVGSQCHSSCVLILAAGRYRDASGASVGVHRPRFYDNTLVTPDNMAELYQPMFDKMDAYLRAFGVSPQVVHLMMTTPSSKIRVLSDQEREDLGLGKINVIADEMMRNQIEAKCGKDFSDRVLRARNEIELCSESECRDRTWERYGITMENLKYCIQK